MHPREPSARVGPQDVQTQRRHPPGGSSASRSTWPAGSPQSQGHRSSSMVAVCSGPRNARASTRPPGEPQQALPDTPPNHVPRKASGNMALLGPPAKACSQNAFREHGFPSFIRGSQRGHWEQDFPNHAAEFAAFTWRSPTDVKTVAHKPPTDVPRHLHETSRDLSAATRAR